MLLRNSWHLVMMKLLIRVGVNMSKSLKEEKTVTF